MQILPAVDDLAWRGLDLDEQELNSSLMAMIVVKCRLALALFYWQQPVSEFALANFNFFFHKGGILNTYHIFDIVVTGRRTGCNLVFDLNDLKFPPTVFPGFLILNVHGLYTLEPILAV